MGKQNTLVGILTTFRIKKIQSGKSLCVYPPPPCLSGFFHLPNISMTRTTPRPPSPILECSTASRVQNGLLWFHNFFATTARSIICVAQIFIFSPKWGTYAFDPLARTTTPLINTLAIFPCIDDTMCYIRRLLYLSDSQIFKKNIYCSCIEKIITDLKEYKNQICIIYYLSWVAEWATMFYSRDFKDFLH